MSYEDAVMLSLELAAERADDLTRPIYDRFAALAPAYAGLMSHMDTYMLGRMMSDALTLMMTSADGVDRQYLRFELDSHKNYGVTPDMFPPLLTAVRDTVRATVGDRWCSDMDAAWTRRIAEHLEQIQRLTSAQA
jgi:hypothetical protein